MQHTTKHSYRNIRNFEDCYKKSTTTNHRQKYRNHAGILYGVIMVNYTKICLSTLPPPTRLCLSGGMSAGLPFPLSLLLCIHTTVCLSPYLSVHVAPWASKSMCLLSSLPACLPVYLSVRVSACLSVRLRVRLFACSFAPSSPLFFVNMIVSLFIRRHLVDLLFLFCGRV